MARLYCTIQKLTVPIGIAQTQIWIPTPTVPDSFSEYLRKYAGSDLVQVKYAKETACCKWMLVVTETVRTECSANPIALA